MDKNTHLKTNPLNHLITPVKKATKKLYTNQLHLQPVKNFHLKSNEVPKDVTNHNLKDLRRQTSSVILRSITRKIVHEQYSFLNLANQETNRTVASKDKKLIKVIVRPKTTKTQAIQLENTTRIFNKRFATKKSQSTVSFQGSSAKNQHIYFSFKGRQRDKVYEIKSTESDKLSNKNFNSKYGYVSKEQVTNCKRLIETLNMERKKPKDKRNKSPCRCSKLKGSRDCTVADCPFLNVNNDRPQRFQNTNNHKSRVTIVGRLGQTDTETYLLQCATTATMNNNPISTSPILINTSVQDQQLKVQPYRDSTVQTDFCFSNVACDSRFQHEVCNKNRLISQGTQVNIVANSSPNIQSTDNAVTTHCICKNTPNDAKEIDLKKCQSPLVVISVYPRQDLVNTDNKYSTKSSPKKVSPQRHKINETLKVPITDRIRSKSRLRQPEHGYVNSTKSRTPSPSPRSVVKNDATNKITRSTSNKIKDTRRKNLPNHQIHQMKSKELEGKNQLINNCRCSNFIPNKEANVLKNGDVSQLCKIKQPNRNEFKKALVDDFLNNVATKDETLTNYFLHIPTNNASKLTINIDGDNDRYDVVLKKCNLDTNLFIKKATKRNKSKEYQDKKEDLDMDSMESYLMLLKEKDRADKEDNKRNVRNQNLCDPKTSSFKAQDSLEVCLRRENRNGHTKKKKKPCNGNVIKSDALAPVKHYRGDDCSISDPNERDKEIRELLGIMRGQKVERREKLKNRNEANNKKWARDSCRIKCSKSLMTGHSLLRFAFNREDKNKVGGTQCTNMLPGKSNPKTLKIDKRTVNNNRKTKIKIENQISANHKNILDPFNQVRDASGIDTLRDRNREQNMFAMDQKVFRRDVQDISQNLILNRNVQVFLQVEQFTKQKPIKLTKKQYDKLKKVIKSTISRKLSQEKRSRCSPKNCSFVSIGEVKARPKGQRPLYYNREIQTEPFKLENNGKGIQTDCKQNNRHKQSKKELNNKNADHLNVDTISKSDVDVKEKHAKSINQISTRPTVSSMEIRFANISYMNHVNISSTRCSGDGPASNKPINTRKDSKSIHTIFKASEFSENSNGFKKTATPNLGTSVYSLYSDVSAESEISKPNDAKPKKPFLRRLISCLVMRSNQLSTLKGAFEGSPKLASVNSSVDSYHISTSLGAFEMSSALYDTSASFYSNHTILPVNKMKRSFFSSVRGFLRNRRGQT